MDDTLVSRLLARAAARPDHPAIVDEARSVSYGELGSRTRSAAARLEARGVRPGDTIALSFVLADERVADFAGVLYGAAHLGAALLPLYPDVPAGRRRELAAAFGARWSISAQAEDLGVAGIALGEVCDKFHVPTQPLRGDTGERPFYLQFSSGTSGNPKALSFTQRQFSLSAASNVATYGWGPGTRLIPAVRVPSKVGIRYLLRVLFAGGTLLNLPFPGSRERLAELAGHYGANAASAAPVQLRHLLASGETGAGAPALGFLSAIGAPINADEVRAVRAGITPHLYVGYGSTESGLIATLRPQDDAADGYTPVAGMEVEVVDHTGMRLAAGAQGHIRLRAPWMPQSYAGNPAETAKRFRDGWFYPGDAAALDARGRIHVRGRADGIINFGGVKIIPEDVEAQLLAHPGVADAMVTGVPDANYGEIPVAFVVLRTGTTLEALKAYCDERIDAFAMPELILSLERMPRSADGKIERARLKAFARSHLARGEAGG